MGRHGKRRWTFEKTLPYFRRLETDTDFPDDFHGTDGPIIARRFKRNEWLPSQSAFYEACRTAGFSDTSDHNNPDASGVGPVPMNNPNGIRWSTNLGYLSMSRHRLNLTIKADCLVHRIVVSDGQATGVIVESGGQTFAVRGGRRSSSAQGRSDRPTSSCSRGSARRIISRTWESRSSTTSRESARTSGTIPSHRSAGAPGRDFPWTPTPPGFRSCCATPPPGPTCETTCRYFCCRLPRSESREAGTGASPSA